MSVTDKDGTLLASYAYGPLDTLNVVDMEERFYQGDELVTLSQDGKTGRSLVRGGGQLLAEQQSLP